MDIYMKDTYKSLNEVLKIAKPYDVIYLDDITYNEKIILDIDHITLIGKENTKIVYNDYHSKIKDGIKIGTTKSATFTLTPNANYFKAFNITFENNHLFDTKLSNQAVAFKSEAFNLEIDNCRFIGNQDTLYLDYGSDNIIKNSYITGNIDFIFGSADCIFYNCIIKSNNLLDYSYFLAPDTFIQNLYGFIFVDSKFISDAKISTYLARPWYPSGALSPVLPKFSIINCKFVGNIILSTKQMEKSTRDDYIFNMRKCSLNDEEVNRYDILKNERDYLLKFGLVY